MDKAILSTMVVLYKTNLNFDTTALVHAIPIDSQIIKAEKRGVIRRGESKRDRIKRRSKKESSNTTGFCHNSITLVLMNDGDGTLVQKEITVKIFQNGIFHMTGILHENYDKSCMRILMSVLQEKCLSAIKDLPEKVEIINRRIVLMNYTTKLSSNDTIAREQLHNNIRSSKFEDITSHYDPDVYPGVKICIGNKNWTAKVFRTGKIILTGIVSSEECGELIQQLLSLFEKVLPQKPKSNTRSSQVGLSISH